MKRERMLSTGNEDRILVSARLRPLNEKEILGNEVSDWECINDDTIVYKNANLLASERSKYPTAYTFDRVFGSSCSTREVYDKIAKNIIISSARGINSTVLAYGQTNSGKTYTMIGITIHAIADIYEYVQKHPERDFIMKLSAMEIYNESVRDLLTTNRTPLRLIDDPQRGTIIEKLTEEVLRDQNHAMQLLSVCEAQRLIRETTHNDKGTRSHQIIRLTIESSIHGFLGRGNASTLAATVNLVDLAGSEQASLPSSAGTRIKEGCHKNQSLLTLGTVIRKLRNQQNGHIPYSDSKLTRILQTSLGGNARTAIICTLSPARSHVEQSRNTLTFASCAKEVTANAKVNVVISDKASVLHLQKEVEKQHCKLGSHHSNSSPTYYSAILKEKDAQIEKLEMEIKDLILQRDIAQSQVKELLQILGDHDHPMARVGQGNYPHLRVRKSSDVGIQEKETSTFSDIHSLDIDNGRGHNGKMLRDYFVRVPYIRETCGSSNASRSISRDNSFSNIGDSDHCWEGVEIQNKETLEDTCQEIHCNTESRYLFSEDYTDTPAVKVQVNGEVEHSESPRSAMPSPSKDDNEVKEHETSGVTPSNKVQELTSATHMENKESISQMLKNKNDFSSLQCLFITSLKNPLQYLSITSLDNPSLERHLARDTLGNEIKNSKASTVTNSISPWLTEKQYSDYTPSFGSERELDEFQRNVYALKFGSAAEKLTSGESPSLPESNLDINFDSPVVNVSAANDGEVTKTNTLDMSGKPELSTEREIAIKSDDKATSDMNKPPKMNVNDGDMDPVADDQSTVTSWPVEFRRLQKAIIALWDACNVSLVHRTYFFLLFQGDPSDAIYLQVEIRKLKLLKDKFSRGEKTIMNGQYLMLSSSKKDLRNERQMLSKQMTKKFSEKEREGLFAEWGIGLNTKMRRQRLAELVWTKTDDMSHIAGSALLVAKLVGMIEPGQPFNKEMRFGLDFSSKSKSASGISSFKRSLVSIL